MLINLRTVEVNRPCALGSLCMTLFTVVDSRDDRSAHYRSMTVYDSSDRKMRFRPVLPGLRKKVKTVEWVEITFWRSLRGS